MIHRRGLRAVESPRDSKADGAGRWVGLRGMQNLMLFQSLKEGSNRWVRPEASKPDQLESEVCGW